MRTGPKPDEYGCLDTSDKVSSQLEALADFLADNRSAFSLEKTTTGSWSVVMKSIEPAEFETECHVGRTPVEAIYRLLKGLSEQ